MRKLIFIAVFAMAPLCQAQTIVITGKVTFQDGASPVTGHVTLANSTVVKDAMVENDGTYVISGVPFGTYDLSVFAGTSREVGRAKKTGIVVGPDTAAPLVLDLVLAGVPSGS